MTVDQLISIRMRARLPNTLTLVQGEPMTVDQLISKRMRAWLQMLDAICAVHQQQSNYPIGTQERAVFEVRKFRALRKFNNYEATTRAALESVLRFRNADALPEGMFRWIGRNRASNSRLQGPST